MSIAWEKVDPSTYEDLVAVLLQQLYPSVERIDGSGGDDGRDVQLRQPDGELHIFELKSFSQRMGKSQRAQVKHSLATATALAPTSWTLITPIIPTPGELACFDGLRDDRSFPLAWRDRTWLESHLSGRPAIERYFLQDAHHEVVRLLTEMRLEDAAIDDAPDAVSRLRRLHSRLNDIDPLFRYDLALGASVDAPPPPGVVMSVSVDDVRVDVFEQFRGALKQRPINITLNLRFGDADSAVKEEVAQAFDFGHPVTIPEHVVETFTVDAPSGLGGTFTHGRVALSPADAQLSEPIATTGAVMGPSGNRVAALPFEFTRRMRGRRGVVLEGADATGCISLTLKLDADVQRLNLTYDFQLRSLVPGALIPAVRWMSSLRPPNSLSLLLNIKGGEEELPIGAPPQAVVGYDLVELVESLDHLQRESGDFFPLPDDLTGGEADGIIEASALLRGEQLESGWADAQIAIRRPDDLSAMDQLRSDEGAAVGVVGLYALHLRDHVFELGEVVTEMKSARLADGMAEELDAAAPGTDIQLRLVPGVNNLKTQWKRVSPAGASSPGALGPT